MPALRVVEAQAKETTEFYKSGSIKAKGLLVNGAKNGTWVYFYPNGKKNAVESYREGFLDGKVTYYYPFELSTSN